MAQFCMVIDLNRCLGCHTCSVSCKAEYNVPDNEGRCWVKRLGPAQTPYGISHTFYPGLCMQCSNPVCVEVCPVEPISIESINFLNGQTIAQKVSATWKDHYSGIVHIDSKRCIGCGECVTACPYQARFLNASIAAQKKAEKCDFCYERLTLGQQPFCVETCLGGARIFGDLDDPESEVSLYKRNGAVPLLTKQVDTRPNVLYLGKRKDLFLLKKTSQPR